MHQTKPGLVVHISNPRTPKYIQKLQASLSYRAEPASKCKATKCIKSCQFLGQQGGKQGKVISVNLKQPETNRVGQNYAPKSCAWISHHTCTSHVTIHINNMQSKHVGKWSIFQNREMAHELKEIWSSFRRPSSVPRTHIRRCTTVCL